MKKRNRALLIIDAQKGFQGSFYGPRNNPNAESQLRKILAEFRKSGELVIHIQHHSKEKDSPLRPDQDGVRFIEGLEPLETEFVFRKSVHSAFIGTELESFLRGQGIEALVATGFTSDHCVSTTTRMGCDLGFDMTLISDATVAYDRGAIPAQMIHEASLASLSGEFAQILTTSELLENL